MDKKDIFIIAFESILLISSIVLLVTGIRQFFGYNYILTINDSNREQVEQYLMLEDTEIPKGKLIKIADKQALGDWTFYLFYEDGTEEERMYNDGEQQVLRKYLWENGHDEIKSAEWKIVSSIVGILLLCFLEVGERKNIKIATKISTKTRRKNE